MNHPLGTISKLRVSLLVSLETDPKRVPSKRPPPSLESKCNPKHARSIQCGFCLARATPWAGARASLAMALPKINARAPCQDGQLSACETLIQTRLGRVTGFGRTGFGRAGFQMHDLKPRRGRGSQRLCCSLWRNRQPCTRGSEQDGPGGGHCRSCSHPPKRGRIPWLQGASAGLTRSTRHFGACVTHYDLVFPG